MSRDAPKELKRGGAKCGFCPQRIKQEFMLCTKCKSMQELIEGLWRTYERPRDSRFK